MASSPQPPLDPARDAASVLRRVGVLTLMIALPLSAAAFRIGPVVAYVVGLALLLAAAALDGSPRVAGQTLLRIVHSTPFLAAGLAVGWAATSLIWSPATPSRQAGALGGILGLGLVGIAALPERMRAANLYPMALGTGALALVAMVLVAGYWGDEAEGRVRQFERVLAVLVLFAWPAIAWLRSRGRDLEALALAVATAGAAAFGPSPAPVTAFAAGALAHLAAQSSGRGGRMVGLMLAVVLAAAPALVAVAAQVAPTPRMDAWHAVLLGDPLRLLTGHGTGSMPSDPDLAAMRGASGLVAWYQFGVVGIGAMAAAIATAMARSPTLFGPLAPGLCGAATTAFVLAAAGIGGGALWWPALLVTVLLLFVAAQRGQFRTRRPRALLSFAAKGGAP